MWQQSVCLATLEQYLKNDYHTGMNITEMAEPLYSTASGYPFLVGVRHLGSSLRKENFSWSYDLMQLCSWGRGLFKNAPSPTKQFQKYLHISFIKILLFLHFIYFLHPYSFHTVHNLHFIYHKFIVASYLAHIIFFHHTYRDINICKNTTRGFSHLLCQGIEVVSIMTIMKNIIESFLYNIKCKGSW